MRILEKNTKPAIKLMVSALLIIVTKRPLRSMGVHQNQYYILLIFELVVAPTGISTQLEGDFQVLG
jgi:hypothetical protein